MNLPKMYTPGDYESNIYDLWIQADAFKADPTSKKERFSIAMPPPNETGTLSIGHSLFLSIQDILTRHARQMGKDALWLPGTDHAALAVNALIEKQLTAEGTNKHAIGREAFLTRTRDFVGNSRDVMIKQMRAMGISADWSRMSYTLEDTLSRCVNETFVKMYDKGIIYRGHRIVNWDSNLETTVSDVELEHVEEQTILYTFQYGPFQIVTARPETKFGDKYVVMHPDDERFAQYKHGDTFTAEWINGPVEAAVIKDEAIDMAFGTGVMTITPWHDQTDFDIAEKHGLDREQIIDFHGRLTDRAGDFAGIHIDQARPKIVEKLRAKGLVVKEEAYTHNVAVNSRGKGKVEPQIRLQWFVDVNKPAVEWKGQKKSLKQVMQDVTNDGDITITPSRFEKMYFAWVDSLRDWCVTRQIWWGHRVPAWYRTDTDGKMETYVGVLPPNSDDDGWNEWQQDADTLDTWFSSALWTWSTLIDREKAKDYSLSFEDILKQSIDYQTYHPTDVMETGWDIIFFWVARMILATTFMTGTVPFKRVYLHGMVRAEDGKKMSKSRPESIIDPLTIIPQYGTDALRTALVWGTSPGQDFNWSTPKIEATRNFCNKLWNIARYIESVVGDMRPDYATLKLHSTADHWMMSKLQHITKRTAVDLEKLKFSEAFDGLYHFVWDDIADWYVEASKLEQNITLLAYMLDSVLKLLHPFTPFVTETIWQTLDLTGDELLMLQPWPKHTVKADSLRATEFDGVKDVIVAIRNTTTSLQVTRPKLYYTESNLIENNTDLIARMARLKSITKVTDGKGVNVLGITEGCWLDIDPEQSKAHSERLITQKTILETSIQRLQARLDNKAYTNKAPKQMVQQTRDQLDSEKVLLDAVLKELQ